MTRQTIKNRINRILRNETSGLHSDDYWNPIHNAFNAIREAGFDLIITNTRYGQDEHGNPTHKVWLLEINMGSKKPIFGICTAHGAGTVADPLSRYDVSAYVS